MQSTASTARPIISPISGYQKILIAHDGSEMADKALEHAAYISKIASAELLIVNVIDPDIVPPSFLLSFIRPDYSEDKAKEDLKNKFEGAVNQMLEARARIIMESGLSKVTQLVRRGKPAEEIIKLADEENCHLIVLASTRISSPLTSVGSVTRRVVNSTRKPVLIIHG
jgi:nucleotide-binding universal stress UspA family protein